MKKRMLSSWTVTRVFYLIVGIAIIYQAIIQHQWIGVLFGAYFTAMGLFAFGCASGNCYNGTCKSEQQNETMHTFLDIEHHEVKK